MLFVVVLALRSQFGLLLGFHSILLNLSNILDSFFIIHFNILWSLLNIC